LQSRGGKKVSIRLGLRPKFSRYMKSLTDTKRSCRVLKMIKRLAIIKL
jgi:hypothetical protein